MLGNQSVKVWLLDVDLGFRVGCVLSSALVLGALQDGFRVLGCFWSSVLVVGALQDGFRVLCAF